MILNIAAMTGMIRRFRRLCQKCGKIKILYFPMVHFWISFQEIEPANYIIQLFITKFSQEFTDLFSKEPEKCYNIIGFSMEPFSQFSILCCNANRTSIKVAFAHHNTSKYNQSGC